MRSLGVIRDLIYLPGTFPKTCGCGAKFTEAEWQALPYPTRGSGSPIFEIDDGLWGEMKNCGCGSTIVVGVEEP